MKKGDFFFSCPASGRGLFGSLGRSFGRTASSERSTLERVDELIRYVIRIIDCDLLGWLLLASSRRSGPALLHPDRGREQLGF